MRRSTACSESDMDELQKNIEARNVWLIQQLAHLVKGS